MNRKLRSIATGLAISLSSITLFFLVAEGLTRLHNSYIAEHKIDIVYDKTLRLEGSGFEKPPGVFRILILGDSITYGQGVKKEETFSEKLEGLLNNDGKGGKFEVINTGIPGLNTTEELAIFLDKGLDPGLIERPVSTLHRGIAYQPDIVILQYTVTNDVETPLDVDLSREKTKFHGGGG